MSDKKLALTAENLKVFSKMAALKEASRVEEMKTEVINKAFRTAVASLRPAFGSVQIDSPKSDLTEFSAGELSGKIAATLTVNTMDGTKRIPVTFKVKASVPTLVETTAEIDETLSKAEGSLDAQVKAAQEAQAQKLALKEAEHQAAQEIERDLLLGVDIEASKNHRIFKAAKKEKILDMGIDSNGWVANTFPQQVITHPKTYLPAMKVGQKINLGGFIYKYVGDVPTITGDTNNGVLARFEYVAPFSKAASVSKAAAGYDYANMPTDQLKDILTYEVHYHPEDIDKDAKDRIAQDTEMSKWYLEQFKTLEDAMKHSSPEIVSTVGKSPRYSMDIYKHFAGSNGVPLDMIPEPIKNAIVNDTKTLVSFAKEFPRAMDNESASTLATDPEAAAEVMEYYNGEAVKVAPQIKEILEPAAKKTDWYGQEPAKEEGEELSGEDKFVSKVVNEEMNAEEAGNEDDGINPDAPEKLTEEETKPTEEETEGKKSLEEFSDTDRGVPTNAAPEPEPAKTREELVEEVKVEEKPAEEVEPAKIFNN